MDQEYTYQPEDMEELLLNKSFKELLPEEKKFVLNHLESEVAYNQMRDTLLAIKKTADQDNLITPETHVKHDLLALLDKKKKRGVWFTLNGVWAFLFPQDETWYRKPAFQFASLALLVTIGFLGGKQLLIKDEVGNLAYNPRNNRGEESKPLVENINGLNEQKETTETLQPVTAEGNSKQKELIEKNDFQTNSLDGDRIEEEQLVDDKISDEELSLADDYTVNAEVQSSPLNNKFESIDKESSNDMLFEDIAVSKESENIEVGNNSGRRKTNDFGSDKVSKKTSNDGISSLLMDSVSFNGNLIDIDQSSVTMDSDGEDDVYNKDKKTSGSLASDNQVIDLLFTTL